MRRLNSGSWLLVAFLVLAWACGGGRPIKEGGKAESQLSGLALIAPLSSTNITAYRTDAQLTRGEVLATAKTDDKGAFALVLPAYQGHVLVVATGGTYVEPSIGLGVQLGDNELALLVPDFTTGAKLEGLRITPVSTLAVALARFHVAAGRPAAESYIEALQHLHAHFGTVDWQTVMPADLTAPGVVTNLSPEAKAGLLLAGLSQQAKLHAEASDVTPGLTLNAASLVALLVRDASDGTFDGKAASEELKSGMVALSGATLRGDFVQAMTNFIGSARNGSALKLPDVTGFLAGVGTNSDPYLFCPGQVSSSSCGSQMVDIEPPALSFVRPSAGAGVAGSTIVEVRATDNVGIGQLRFTAPASLISTAPVLTDGDKAGLLQATLDVSALPDGPLEVRAEVTDKAGNPAAKTLSLTVSNQGPRLNLTSPGDGATVRGTSVVSATATAQAPGATIARIELVNAVAGLGADTLPAADAFSAPWDTTRALEGPVTLTFRATDSFGTSAEASVTVTVDNVPLGIVSAVVSAGAPVEGLSLKLVAIDDATGLPSTTIPGGPVLGESADVTADGGVSFVLSKENYSGPVQLIAEGPSASYADPTGPSTINLPTSFRFTSYVAFYRAGDRLERPLTFWTTLADAAALAHAQGRNPSRPTPGALTDSLQVVDPLFARHITSASWSLRTVYPVSLTSSSQSLRDVVYAALPNVALNQQARELAAEVGLTAGTGFAAPALVALLLQDVSDGQFDGKAAGVQLRTAGTAPYALDANTTRIRQALATDSFIRSSANSTQLTRSDLQTSGIYDTISSDTSILYPASAAPIPFDNTPPTVSWSVAFEKSPNTFVAPVGTTKLVRGLVRVSVDSTDSSMVASTLVRVAGTAGGLQAGANNTTSHFDGTLDVTGRPDGALTLEAVSCDRLQNCATATYVLTVDNTPPTVTGVRPTAASFVSASFDIEATASDANGIESLAPQQPTGLVDIDPTTGRLLVPASSWTLSSSDGPLLLRYQACDVVGWCTVGGPSVTVDKTAPQVAVTSTIPAFTNQTSLTLSGTVNDSGGAGVKAVYVQNALTFTTVTATLSGTSWSATVSLGSGQNSVKVWGEDLAAPSNTGASASSPYSQTVTLNSDTTPPVLQTRSVTSYRDERGLRVNTDAQGRPVMPVQYVYAGSPVAVTEGGTVYKLRSKASATDDNVPYLRWAVQAEVAPAAPIASATYRIVSTNGVTCTSNCGPRALRASSATEGGFALYELPLFLDPAASASVLQDGVVTSYELSIADAAGNTTKRTFNFTYVLVGAPVVLVADSSLPTYGDAASIFPFTTSSSYPSLIGQTKRVLRYLVYNPNQEPVYVNLALSGFTGSWVELWQQTSGYPANGSMSDQGVTSFDYFDWYSRIYNVNWEAWDSECQTTSPPIVDRRAPFPCGRSTATAPVLWSDPRPVHYFGEAQPFTRCESRHTGTTTTSVGNSAYPSLTNSLALTPGLNVMANPLPTGKEPALAPTVSFQSLSGWSIPAATSGTASAVAAYVTVATPARPTSGVAAAIFPLSGSGQQRFRAGWQFDWTNVDTTLACQVCRGLFCATYSATYYNQGWTGSYFDRLLNSHTVSVGGSLLVKTHPASGTPTPASLSTLPSVPFTYSATR